MLRDTAAAREISTPEFLRSPERPKYAPEDFADIPANYRPAIQAFLCGTPMKSSAGFYKIKADGTELWFIRRKQIKKAKYTTYHKSLCAQKINGEFFGNSSDLWGHRSGNRRERGGKELQIQRELSKIIPMVPFTLFSDTGLDINKLEIMDRGPAEEFDLGRTNKQGAKVLQHFTGAMLFRLGTRYFLFDADRNDIKLKGLNMFMSRIAKPCKTIKDAYASLKPDEVSQAEKFLGHEVQRQGEWFFVPVQGKFEKDESGLKGTTGWGANAKRVAVLQSKGNRAHYVEEISKEGYVRGKVTHGGYEHKPIDLKTWCRAIPNTAVESFKISGEID